VTEKIAPTDHDKCAFELPAYHPGAMAFARAREISDVSRSAMHHMEKSLTIESERARLADPDAPFAATDAMVALLKSRNAI
jgi:hypothetical protein